MLQVFVNMIPISNIPAQICRHIMHSLVLYSNRQNEDSIYQVLAQSESKSCPEKKIWILLELLIDILQAEPKVNCSYFLKAATKLTYLNLIKSHI